MIDFQSRLDALPEWSDCEQYRGGIRWDRDSVNLEAALARLALAHDLAKAGDIRLVRHADDCVFVVFPLRREPYCTCRRDALLAKLERPT